MKAIVVGPKEEGFPLYWAEQPQPPMRPNEVLLEIHSTALNRADLLQRRGHYAPPPGAPDILGLEAAGVIEAVGDQVEGYAPGDRVCTLLGGGGYAEKVTVPAKLLMRVPDHWSFEQAAAVPEVFFTAFLNLFQEGELAEGECVLIHGGASGVGTAAIQLAKAAGARVLVTAGNEDKVARCLELGADVAINYRRSSFADVVLGKCGGRGVDVILDPVGAAYLEDNLQVLAPKGRLVVIGLLSGARAEVNLATLLRKRHRIIGSVLRSRSLEEKIALKEAFCERFSRMLLEDKIVPIIDSVYSIEAVEQAHQRMADNLNIGKIILRVRS